MKPAVPRICPTCIRLPLWEVDFDSVLLWPVHRHSLIRQINGRWRMITHLDFTDLRWLIVLLLVICLGILTHHWCLSCCGIWINYHLMCHFWMRKGLLLLAICKLISYCQMLWLLSGCLMKLTESLLIWNRVRHWWRLIVLKIGALIVGVCIKLLGVCSCWIIDHFLRVGCTALRTLIEIETWGLSPAIISLRGCGLNPHRLFHIERRIFIAYSAGFNLWELCSPELLEPTHWCWTGTRWYRMRLRILFPHW